MKKYVLRSENGKKVDNSEVKFAKEENCNKEARERVPEGVPLEEIDPGENSKVAREERKMDETKNEHEEDDPGENVKVGHEEIDPGEETKIELKENVPEGKHKEKCSNTRTYSKVNCIIQ